MAAIDKIYLSTWEQYIAFKEWCEKQPDLKDKYNKSVSLVNFLYKWDKEDTEEKEEEKYDFPVFCAPYYVDAYLIKNCPFEFIQKELKFNYGDSYKEVKEGKLYNTPFTSEEYTIGKHFTCVKHPHKMFNTPFKWKWYDIDVRVPEGMSFMWYHSGLDTWDFSDEFVVDEKGGQSWANCKTIKALKRKMLKWKLPVGAKVIATARLISDDYEFIITK